MHDKGCEYTQAYKEKVLEEIACCGSACAHYVLEVATGAIHR